MEISTSMYDMLSNTSVSWACIYCGTPNHTTVLYESTMSVSNSFSSLQASPSLHDTTGNSSLSQEREPVTSSPKRKNTDHHDKSKDKLRLLQINFQIIKNKTADLEIAIDMTRPDVIIGDLAH